jgi:hypothetical protein
MLPLQAPACAASLPLRRQRAPGAARGGAAPPASRPSCPVPPACSLPRGAGGRPPPLRRRSARPPAAISPPPAGVAAEAPAGAPADEVLPLVLPEDLYAPPGVLLGVRRDANAPVCDLNGYLRKILTARVYEIAVRGCAKTLASFARRAAAPAPLLCCCAPLPALPTRLRSGGS